MTLIKEKPFSNECLQNISDFAPLRENFIVAECYKHSFCKM